MERALMGRLPKGVVLSLLRKLMSACLLLPDQKCRLVSRVTGGAFLLLSILSILPRLKEEALPRFSVVLPHRPHDGQPGLIHSSGQSASAVLGLKRVQR